MYYATNNNVFHKWIADDSFKVNLKLPSVNSLVPSNGSTQTVTCHSKK